MGGPRGAWPPLVCCFSPPQTPGTTPGHDRSSINHQSSIIIHQSSSIINHQSSIIKSAIINNHQQSSIIKQPPSWNSNNHQSSITKDPEQSWDHQSPPRAINNHQQSSIINHQPGARAGRGKEGGNAGAAGRAPATPELRLAWSE